MKLVVLNIKDGQEQAKKQYKVPTGLCNMQNQTGPSFTYAKLCGTRPLFFPSKIDLSRSNAMRHVRLAKIV